MILDWRHCQVSKHCSISVCSTPNLSSETPGLRSQLQCSSEFITQTGTEPPEPAASRETSKNVILTSNPLPSRKKSLMWKYVSSAYNDVKVHFLSLQETKELCSGSWPAALCHSTKRFKSFPMRSVNSKFSKWPRRSWEKWNIHILELTTELFIGRRWFGCSRIMCLKCRKGLWVFFPLGFYLVYFTRLTSQKGDLCSNAMCK